ncbi:hypothetical protein M8A51_13915 [Schlegelella sp. S2-27]|uniref:Uncharacterized protein n=1 Tax=Caldimonas mangrovi TaxID=2944811 RepID=A0ABT0YPF9_9BURK|nr:hypothetical protein [Caldimonas mangrovi]MCM5680625.1 hypothetical protein [Caldimonas mangrovi]
MKTEGHITHRLLPLQGQCAFVRAALEGSSLGMAGAAGTMNELHPVESRRPAVSLGQDGWMHPGKGGA